MGFWMLLVAVAYGVVLFCLFSGLRVAGAADRAADRALLAMLNRQRGKTIGAKRVASAAPAGRRRHTTPASRLLASHYR